MSPRQQQKLSPQAVLSLLDDPAFCDDARRVLARAPMLREQGMNREDFDKRMLALAQPFRDRWGVLPPSTRELLDPDPRRRFVEAVASGNWGVVLVFPWTTDRGIQASVKSIRGTISKWHRDALDRRQVQLQNWLDCCGVAFKRNEIARAVYGWTKGLSRPTKDQAIARAARKNQDLETFLYRKYQQEYEELKVNEADIHRLTEQHVYRVLRGTEAPALAALRMKSSRYFSQLNALNTNLGTPIESEPLSHALTLLFRSLPDADNDSLKLHAVTIKQALLAAAPRPAGRNSLDNILSGSWGIVAVFPWTTNPEIRASVKSVHAAIRKRRTADSLSRSLTLFIQALMHDDDAGLRRQALAARQAALQPFDS
jgi:hypothetical protein